MRTPKKNDAGRAVRQCHNGEGFRASGGVHDSYTFQCRLVGSFTSPGIDTRYKGLTAFGVSSELSYRSGIRTRRGPPGRRPKPTL